MNDYKLKQGKPIKTNWSFSLSLLAGFMILAVGGFFIAKGIGYKGTASILLAGVFILLWLILDGIGVRKQQWVPLLVTGIYWIISSLARLFMSDDGSGSRKVTGFVLELTDFAFKPFIGLNRIHPDLGLLSMAGLTMAALISLIMILDQNKPSTSSRIGRSENDSSDWF